MNKDERPGHNAHKWNQGPDGLHRFLQSIGIREETIRHLLADGEVLQLEELDISVIGQEALE